MMDKEQITDQLVDKIKQLPPMPANIVKLRRTAADINANYDIIAPIIKEDPSVCADVLKLANSARYAAGHRVETVEEAVRLFGMGALVEFIAAVSSDRIVKQFFASVRNLNEYLEHSRDISTATTFICDIMRINLHDHEVYSITGLIHDIGRLIILLVTNKKKFSKETIGVSWEEVHQYVDDEKELYGLDHAELGMRIAQKWQFPDRIAEAIGRHHRPVLNGEISIPGMVLFLSEVIAVKEIPENVVAKALPVDVMKQLRIDSDRLIDARRAYQRARA